MTYDEEKSLEAKQGVARFFGLAVIREADHDHLQPLDYPPCPKPARP